MKKRDFLSLISESTPINEDALKGVIFCAGFIRPKNSPRLKKGNDFGSSLFLVEQNPSILG